jgi:hypothetical protein
MTFKEARQSSAARKAFSISCSPNLCVIIFVSLIRLAAIISIAVLISVSVVE